MSRPLMTFTHCDGWYYCAASLKKTLDRLKKQSWISVSNLKNKDRWTLFSYSERNNHWLTISGGNYDFLQVLTQNKTLSPTNCWLVYLTIPETNLLMMYYFFLTFMKSVTSDGCEFQFLIDVASYLACPHQKKKVCVGRLCKQLIMNYIYISC